MRLNVGTKKHSILAPNYALRTRRQNWHVEWLLLPAILMPSTLAVYVGTWKVNLARIAILVLILPGIAILTGRGRRLVVSDFFVFATAVWMIWATSGPTGLNPTGSLEALEFFSLYIIARAFLFGPIALKAYIKVLQISVMVIVALAVLDPFSGHYFINDIVGSIFKTPTLLSEREIEHFQRQVFGATVLRATSTLDHPILFGSFCCISAIVLLYSGEGFFKKSFFFCLCLLGCIISLSSAPLLGFIIAFGVYAYDCLLSRYRWRWKLLIGLMVLFICTIAVYSDHPIQWLIFHFTLDPETGYYRILIWDSVFAVVPLSPVTGFGFVKFNDPILDLSVDSVWLVQMLHYGIPGTLLLLLSNLVLFRPSAPRLKDSFMSGTGTGLSLAIATFIFLGLTVHFWAAMWHFWAICMGMKGAFGEYASTYSSNIETVPQSEPVLTLRRTFVPRRLT